MTKKKRRPIKVSNDDHDFFKTLKREISEVQDCDVSMGEIIGRMKNIPNSRNILLEDARMKRRRR